MEIYGRGDIQPLSNKSISVQVVLLAGGEGSRLWPLSRRNLPKQFLPLAPDGKTLIQAAFERAVQLTGSEEHIWVSANHRQAALLQQQLPDLASEQLLLEPVGRNTAASLGWAALRIRERNPDAIMVGLSADHLFRNLDLWLQTARAGILVAREFERLVLLGIKPFYPSPHYGYLKISRPLPLEGVDLYEIERFVEKPAPAEAEMFIAQGNVLWNTGVLIGKVEVFLQAFERQLPQAYLSLCRIQANPRLLDEEFAKLPAVSVDVGVLEKETSLLAVQGEFDRVDLGNLIAFGGLLTEDEAGNCNYGVVVDREASENLAITDQGMIGLIGVQGLAVVRWGDVVLVCPQERLDEIKAFQAQLIEEGWERYL